MEREIIIFGTAPGTDREVPLYTKAETLAEAERVRVILERDHGCTVTRIHEWNGAAPQFGRASLNG